MINYYPLIIETSIELRIHIRILMANYRSKINLIIMHLDISAPSISDQDAQNLPLAEGYTVLKQDSMYYCITSNQTGIII